MVVNVVESDLFGSLIKIQKLIRITISKANSRLISLIRKQKD